MTPPTHASATDNVPRALAWMIVSGLSFALMGASVKLAGDLPVTMKVCVRNLVTLGITTAMTVRTRQNPFAPTPHLGMLLVRALCGLFGVYFYFVALGGLTLADASLLNKTSPFFATMAAVLLLREPLPRGMGPALLMAFAGAALVIKPAFDYSPLPALAGTGVFAAGGQFGLTFAYHHARVNKVAVFSYLHVLFALAVGFLVWGERPDLLSLLGGAMIVGAAVLAHRAGTRRA